jgi:hypothetical protein
MPFSHLPSEVGKMGQLTRSFDFRYIQFYNLALLPLSGKETYCAGEIYI